MKRDNIYIKWFDDIDAGDIALVGGKNASLGDMYHQLCDKGVNVPNGFAITADAYWHVLKSNNILDEIKKTFRGLDKNNIKSLSNKAKKVRGLILGSAIPDDLWSEIKQAYDRLCEQYGKNTDVAVRSSATAEDLPTASFAGQQETYLNIRGYSSLKEACSKCFASLFTDRAISYRIDHKFDHFKIALSIGIQKMVRSDLATSGVMFTLDTAADLTSSKRIRMPLTCGTPQIARGPDKSV